MRVLIYSPDPTGHRQVYCDVFTDILLELGADVVIAVGFSTFGELIKWKNINCYATNVRVTIVDCCDFSSTQSDLLTAEELISLQKRFNIDVTIFSEADSSRPELLRIGTGDTPRLKGRNIGIFAWTAYWYPGENPFLSNKKRLTLTKRLRKLKKRLLRQRKVDKKHEFFFREIIGTQRVLDIALVKDERVSDDVGYPFVWLPEIYKPFALKETEEEKLEYESISVDFKNFLARQGEREVLLYFGKAYKYKGYDFTLRLAELDDSVCFVHCGELNDNETFEFDVQTIRSKLSEQDRLYETQRYINSERLLNLFFSSTKRIVSTRRLTGSSGVMLQALDAGKPVLIPNSGLIGYRMKGNNLGMVYRHGDIKDLFKKWKLFKKIPPQNYTDSIQRYMKKFDRNSLVDCFKTIILGL
jgi:hypothetical protein